MKSCVIVVLSLGLMALLWLLSILFIGILFLQADFSDAASFFHDDYFWHVFVFSIEQAFLSALLATVPAIVIALS